MNERRQKLDRRAEDQERLDRARQEFFTVLSHELRGPIQAIQTNAVLIRSRAREVELTRPADAIERQVARLSRILDDLLDVVRLAQGEEMSTTVTSAQEIVSEAVSACQRSMDVHRRELSVQLGDAPLFIRADGARLAQAITNVIGNAIRYSPQQSEVVIRAFAHEAHAVIAVRDQGTGIAAEELPRIFDRFREGVARERTGGLGLGLHLAREIIQLHGGRIEARSEGPGKGSEFSIHIPLTHERPAREKPKTAGFEAPEGLRILVVDDNRDSADSLAVLLEMHGHTGLVAYDGAAAIDKAAKTRPHVALIDISMPTMDGYEVARRISAAHWGAGVTLVAVTGWGARSDRAKSKECGFAYHLTKPVDYDMLASLLSNVARKAREKG